MTSGSFRIVMVHPHDLWHDPWTVRILELARRLQRRGCEVQLVHMPRKERPDHAPLRAPRDDDPPIHELLPRQQHFVRNLRLLGSLAKTADLIHLQKCFPASALPVLWCARRLGKPLHYDWDDDETAISRIVERRWFARWHLAVYEHRLPAFASTITYSSQALRERALRMGYPEERMAHLPVGADLERFHPNCGQRRGLVAFDLDPGRPVVLYIGQLEGAAYAERLVEAAAIVVERLPETQFLFLGGGEQLGGLRARVEASPARAAIRLAGYVAHERVAALVGAADICVACFDDGPAVRAKSPLKIAEYLAAGKAIVASAVGEAPWMVKDCGQTAPPGDAYALAEAILAYALDPERRARDGERARRRAEERFTWERGAETLMKMYALAVNG